MRCKENTRTGVDHAKNGSKRPGEARPQNGVSASGSRDEICGWTVSAASEPPDFARSGMYVLELAPGLPAVRRSGEKATDQQDAMTWGCTISRAVGGIVPWRRISQLIRVRQKFNSIEVQCAVTNGRLNPHGLSRFGWTILDCDP